MKKVKLVMRHYGENSTSAYSLVGPLESVSNYDPEAKKVACVAYDNDMPVEIKRDWLVEVEVPEWFDFNEFRNETTLKFLFAYGYKWSMGEKIFRKMYGLMDGEKSGWPVYVLLNTVLNVKNPRSEFKKSIKAQVEAWLDAEDSKYALPLSPKQFAALGNRWIRLDYDRAGSRAYSSGGCAFFHFFAE